MAKRVPSRKPLQEKRSQNGGWWKTPAVVAAIIGAAATVSVAIINQRAAPKTKPSEPSKIEQQTHGAGSPAIADVQGSVAITRDVTVTALGGGTAVMPTGPGAVHITNIHGISAEEHTRLAKELGVTQAALDNFFKILEQQQVSPTDLDSTLREIAKRYKELQDRLRTFTSDDPAVIALKREASKALEAGDFVHAERLLNEASAKDIEGARQFQEMATKRRLSAAASKAENGRLKAIQLLYAEAAIYYREAADLVESVLQGAEEILATYLNNWGKASYRAGQYSTAEPPLKRALAVLEKVLGGEHPHVATSLNNLAELYRTQGRYAEAEPLYQRALAVGEKTLGLDHPSFNKILENYLLQLQAMSRQAEAEQLVARIQAARPPRGWLGLQLKPHDEALRILVEQVMTDSPAAQAGFQRGDVIVRCQAHTAQDVGAFVRRIAATTPGTRLDCDIERKGQLRTLQVTLGAGQVSLQ